MKQSYPISLSLFLIAAFWFVVALLAAKLVPAEIVFADLAGGAFIGVMLYRRNGRLSGNARWLDFRQDALPAPAVRSEATFLVRPELIERLNIVSGRIARENSQVVDEALSVYLESLEREVEVSEPVTSVK